PLLDLLLHVRERDTGREVEDVFLYELPALDLGSPSDGAHPGPGARAKEREFGPSPVHLERGEPWYERRIFYARSPGFAWGRIELEWKSSESTLLLDPAGELELHVVRGEASTAELELLSSGVPELELCDLRIPPGPTAEFVFEDLPAGRYTARARDYGRLAG